MSDMKCHRCGGGLVDASPVEIYCPNDECWEEDMKLVRIWWKKMQEQKEKFELQRLRKKYPHVD